MFLNFLQKLKIILPFGAILSYFAPVQPLVEAIGILVVIDILTGLLVARFINREPITSRRFFDKIIKLAIFAIGLLAFMLADVAMIEFGIPQHAAPKLYSALYVMYELLSIIENLGMMGLPIAKPILKWLKNRMPEEAKELVEEKNDNQPK